MVPPCFRKSTSAQLQRHPEIAVCGASRTSDDVRSPAAVGDEADSAAVTIAFRVPSSPRGCGADHEAAGGLPGVAHAVAFYPR